MSPAGPAVFVHGNPESMAVWTPLLSQLGREDVFCLSPPAFGAAMTSHFGATMTDYRDWLIARLAEFKHPVDVVGHDWGGAHVVNAVMARPDLVRSWVSDALGLFDPDYDWHPLARVWQTPQDGEQWVTDLVSAPLPQRVQAMMEVGIPGLAAERVAAAQDEDMGRAILSLYRSAAQPAMIQAGRNVEGLSARPGLAISPSADDTTGSEEMQRRVARRAGAQVAVMDGLGHWWMLEDPVRGAHVLTDFWSRLN